MVIENSFHEDGMTYATRQRLRMDYKYDPLFIISFFYNSIHFLTPF